jgi:glycosyltransferase involved in cell wall biosynthesis
MRFSIIVPVYNTAPFLAGCIGALKHQDYDRDRYEILLVDNNSTDGSADILAAATGVTVLSETKQGSYAARNLGVRMARGEVIAFTDSDCLPEPGWLRAIDTAFADRGLQVVLGSRRPQRETGLVSLLCDYDDKKAELVIGSDRADAHFAYTNNLAVRRTTFDTYGPFVERHRGADSVFLRRVVEGEGARSAAYEPRMRVVHAEMASVASYCKKTFIYGRSIRDYSRLADCRPLTMIERLNVFRSTRTARGYTPVQTMLLAALLVVGMAAWKLGNWSGVWDHRSGD